MTEKERKVIIVQKGQLKKGRNVREGNKSEGTADRIPINSRFHVKKLKDKYNEHNKLKAGILTFARRRRKNPRLSVW